jgi:cytochrome P450
VYSFLLDYIVPKGTLVCVSPVAYHLMKDSVYTDPYKFDPARFGASRQEDKKDQYSYLSFSQGIEELKL